MKTNLLFSFLKKHFKVLVTFTVFFLFLLSSSFAQEYSHQVSGQNFERLSNAEEIDFSNNELQSVKTNIVVVIDDIKHDHLYVSNEGWLSFDNHHHYHYNPN